MIYKLIANTDVFDLNPGLRAVEAYNKLTSQQMFFVVLTADPSRDNPLRTLSGRARRERAAILAGYKFESDGKRLDKNARNLVLGNVASVEAAIEEFKKNSYNERDRNREAIKKQITEIRDFLEGDKRIPLIEKGKIIVDTQGKEIYITDQKALKLAVELGTKLPELEEALDKYEDPTENKYEGATYTSDDLPPEIEGEDKLSTIDSWHIGNEIRKE